MAAVKLPAPARAFVWRHGRRAVDWSASKLKLASYVPLFDYREQLDLHTTYREDPRPVRDKRSSTVSAEDVDLTLTVEGLEDVLHGRNWSGKRMLEVGPKYGLHALWIDQHLRPTEPERPAEFYTEPFWRGRLEETEARFLELLPLEAEATPHLAREGRDVLNVVAELRFALSQRAE